MRTRSLGFALLFASFALAATIPAQAWTTRAPMPTPRYNLAADVIGEKLYAVGGSDSQTNLSVLEVYDYATNTWQTSLEGSLASMPTARQTHAAAVIGGKLHVVGGVGAAGRLSSLEVYDPVTNTWETKTSMGAPRSQLAAAVINGKLYVVGGYGAAGRVNTLEVYDPATDTWQTKPGMAAPRDQLAAATIDGKLYVVGGSDPTFSAALEVYDPATNTWETKASMPTAREGIGAAVINGKLHVVGGNSESGTVNAHEVYDPVSNTWETLVGLPTPRWKLATVTANGALCAVGGYNMGSFYNTLEIYDPTKNISGTITTTTWTAANSPYRVTGAATVPPGNTLTIEPGVDVLFDADVQFIVQGSIQALGTEAQKIRFMNGTAAEWGGLRLSDGQASAFQYVQFSGGKAEGTSPANLGGALMVTGGGTSVNVSNCLFSSNNALHGGAVAFTAGAAGQFSATTFTGNTTTSWGGAVYITSAGAVSFAGCTFENNTSGTRGGAVAVDQSMGVVSFQSTAFRQNHSGSESGAVELYGASGKVVTATFTDCLIENNTAVSDAMIYGEDYSNTTITNCVFRNNTGSSHGAGLALYGSAAFATVTGSVFANNTASRGAALSIKWYATLNATNCTFVGNNITEAGMGGAVYTYYNTTVNLKNCVVWGNTPNQMYAQSTAINVTHSDIQGGYAGTGNISADPLFVSAATGDYRLQPTSPCIDAGDPLDDRDPDGSVADMGVFYFDKRVDDYHVGGVIETTSWPAGGTYHVVGNITIPAENTLTIGQGVQVLFDANAQILVEGALNAVGADGDGLVRFVPGSSSTWAGLRFVGGGSNTLHFVEVTGVVSEGGGGFKPAVAEPRARGARRERPARMAKQAETQPGGLPGGGIVVTGTGTRLELTHSRVHGNTGALGGGIYVVYGATLNAADCDISNNNTVNGYGGGIYLEDSRASFADCLIESNTTDGNGGGLDIEQFSVSDVISFTRCTIADNVAGYGGTQEAYGGGIEVYNARISLTDCIISGNTAPYDGGGVDFYGSSANVTIANCRFENNTGGQGGAIYTECATTIERTLFANNTARPSGYYTEGYGGAVYQLGYSSPLTITKCTFTGNRALDGTGGALYHEGSVTIASSILWGNTPNQVQSGGEVTANINYSDIEGGWEWEGLENINVSPSFVDAEGGDYRLLADSPCIDTGDPAAHLDPDGTRADMGVFPFNQLWAGDPASVSATVTSTTWTVENSPYRVTGTVFVPAGNTLTIGPGVEVFFDADVPFVVEGKLNAVGTAASPIRFAPGNFPYWGGLKFTGGANTLEHVEITGVHVWPGVGPKPTRAERIARAEQQATAERPARPARNARPARPTRPERAARPAGAARPARTAKVTYYDPDFTGGAIVVLNPGTSLNLQYSVIDGNSGYNGGGIQVANGASLTAVESQIVNNWADEYGGGVYLRDATASFQNCDISHNEAYYAGGGLDIYNSNVPGTVTFVGCVVDSNIVSSSEGYGGGMEVQMPGLTLSLTGCTIAGNHAAEDGGGLDLFGYAEGGTALGPATITGTRFQFNSSRRGGAVYTDCPTTFERSLFANNVVRSAVYYQSPYGGALYVSESGSTTLQSCTLSGNVAEINGEYVGGHGVYCDYSASVSIRNSIVWGQSEQLWWPGFQFGKPAAGAAAPPAKPASNQGFAVSFSDISDWFAEMFDNTISSDPRFVDPGNGDYRLQATSPCINTGDYTQPLEADGTVADMGAFWFDTRPGKVLTGYQLTGTPPAGVWRVKNSVTILPENTLTIQPGTDLIFDTEDAAMIVRGALSAEGTSKTVAGRIRFFTEMSPSEMSSGRWGGIRFEDATGPSTLSFVNIAGSRAFASYGNGGAISVINGEGNQNRFPVALTHVDITDCDANYNGGAIYVSNADVAITGGAMSGNSAENASGGAVYADWGSAVTMSRVVLAKNTSWGDGGGVYVGEGASVNMTNCTVVDNTVGYEGSGKGVYCSYYGNATIVNSILWGDPGQVFGPGMAKAASVPLPPARRPADGVGQLSIAYSDIVDDLSWFEGVISEPPLFIEYGVGIANPNYRLQAGSPCIGTGALLDPENLEGPRADMGAFAYDGSYLYGPLTGNTVWESGTYFLAGTVTVPAGYTLQIDPGVQVLALADAALIVEGTLTAEGTELAPITFRNGDEQKRWGGLHFYNSAGNTITNAEITGVFTVPGYGGGEAPKEGEDLGAMFKRTHPELFPPLERPAASRQATGQAWNPRLSKAERRAERAAEAVAGVAAGGTARVARTAYVAPSLDEAGGAIVALGEVTHLDLANTHIHHNVGFIGGGIKASYGAVVTLDNCDVTANKALYAGGGINASLGATVTITNSRVTNNRSYFGPGGGVRVSAANATLTTNCVVTGNIAAYGGGLVAEESAQLNATDCTIAGNTAQRGDYGYYEAAGGGVNIGYSTASFTNCQITNNGAANGGGVWIDASEVEFTDCSVNNNNATATDVGNNELSNGYGGGLYVYRSDYILPTTVTVTGGIVAGNTGISGGGVFVGYDAYAEVPLHPTVSLTGCTINNNAATSSYGGGIEAPGGALTITDCVFSGNTSYWEGAAGDLYGASASISGCRFENNTAGGSGGALWLETNATITKSVFVGNRAMPRMAGGEGSGSTSGGAVLNSGTGSLSVERCTFVANEAVQADGVVILPPGGGIWSETSIPVRSSIVWGNTPDQIIMGGLGIPQTAKPAPYLPVTFSDVQMDEGTVWEGTGNINADPLFVNAAEGDFHLTVYSPCINTGDPADAPDPNGTRADMGAFPLEFKTGDVTMDGGITTQDASQVLQFSVKLIPSIPFALADVTNNGRATALDAAMILYKWLRLSLNEDFTFPLDEGYYNQPKLAIPANPRTLTWERTGSAWELRADSPDGLMAGEFAFNVGPDIALSAEAGEHFAANRDGEIIRVAFARLDFTSPVLIRLVDDGRLLTPPSIASMELNDGTTPILRVVRPVEFALEQNTPNPFNPTTTIRFGLPAEGPVQLAVYDITGRVVRTLVDNQMEAGVHAVTWDGRDAVGRDVASGTYVYRLVAPNGVLVKRMVMVK